MIIVTSEYIFIELIKNERNNIINNKNLEHDKKHGDNYCREFDFKYNNQFFDKIKNKTENITTIHGIKRTIMASHGRYNYFKVNKIIFLLEGSISKNVMNTYMKCNNIPLLWRNFF